MRFDEHVLILWQKLLRSWGQTDDGSNFEGQRQNLDQNNWFFSCLAWTGGGMGDRTGRGSHVWCARFSDCQLLAQLYFKYHYKNCSVKPTTNPAITNWTKLKAFSNKHWLCACLCVWSVLARSGFPRYHYSCPALFMFLIDGSRKFDGTPRLRVGRPMPAISILF